MTIPNIQLGCDVAADATPTALLGLDADGHITQATRLEPLLGYRDDEVLGWPVTTLVPQSQPVLNAIHQEHTSTGPIIRVPCRRRDGSEFLAEMSFESVRSQDGTQVWAALQQAPDWHRTVVNSNLLNFIAGSTSDAIISATLDGIITYWNPAAERLYGYRATEMVGQPVQQLYGGDGDRQWESLREELSLGESVSLGHVTRVRKDGSQVLVSVTVSPIVDGNGHVVGAASVARDIGAGERAEVRFRALLEAATVAIIGVTGEGKILLTNAEAERLFGYSRTELIGQPVELLVPDAYQGVHAGLRDGYMAEPRTRPMGAGLPLAARRKDGSEFPVDVSLASMETEDGLLVAAAVRDLTQQRERERLEQQLQQTHRLDSLGQLAGGIAHDFNNLMAVIGGYAEFIIQDAEELTAANLDKTRDGLIEEATHIQSAVGRATHLTRQLLVFGRREVTRPEMVDLNEAVREATALLHRTLGEHITIDLDLASDLLAIAADPSQLEQIIINAAVNARDAMPNGGTLTIDTRNVTIDETYAEQHNIRPGQYVRIRIADTGTGMSKDVVAHAFEPFFTTKPTGQGTGLGLSTVYGIIARHDGNVELYSEPGHGTTLLILLPAASQLASTMDGTERTKPPASTVPNAAPARRTILVVDDEPGLREVTRRIVTRIGHDVLVAEDGVDAMELASRHTGPIDLLLTDVIMPRMLGKELAQSLTAQRPGLRVLYMSGYAQPVLAAQGVLDPGTVLLEKPFTEASLRAALASMLETPA